MARWSRKTLKLKKNHGWSAKPGYNIFAADRGAVRFDFPKHWIVKPGDDGSIRFTDRQPPDDNCTLAVSVMYLPDLDWSGLPLSFLVEQIARQDRREVLGRGEMVEVRRPRLDAAWTELRFQDPHENRAARSRICLARWSNIQPLITFDFWEEDASRFTPVWDEVLKTLVLGDYVEDPTQRVLD